MSHLRKSMISSPKGSKPNSRVSSRSNSRAPNSRVISTGGNDTDDEDEAGDFSFASNLDELILAKLSSPTNGLVTDDEEGSIISTASTTTTTTATNPTTTTSISHTHSIPDLLQSLSKSRTEISTESRELILARIYHLMIVGKPLISQQIVNEFDVENLIRYYSHSRTEAEKLLCLKVITTYSCGDIEEVSSVIMADFLPQLIVNLKDVENVSPAVRSNIMICYSALLLCIYDGSGAYGLDETLWQIFELTEGLLHSTEKQQELDLIINSLHCVALILTVLYHGEFELNDLIQELCERSIVFLEDDDLNVAKAAGRLVATMYELYDYTIEEDQDYEGNSPYFDYEEIHSLISRLATKSSKSISKKLKKETKSVFRDILATIEGYHSQESRTQLAKTPITLSHLKLSKARSLNVQSWYSFIRLIHLRYVFNSGLHENLAVNADLSQLIKKPYFNEAANFRNNNDDDEILEEEETGNFSHDHKRKISAKKKDIAINNARTEKMRKELEELDI